MAILHGRGAMPLRAVRRAQPSKTFNPGSSTQNFQEPKREPVCRSKREPMVAMEKGAGWPPSPWLWLVTCSGRADLARVRVEGLCRRSIGGLAGFGLAARDGVLEPIALAIHLQDMDMMGEAIEKSPRS